MANFVLVHGAWQGAWVWQGVSAALRMRGHQVVELDLPGHGADATPLAEISLTLYAERIGAAVRAVGKPVTLVGHSMGGVACAAAAELVPDSLARLIYLCAFAPVDGDTLTALTALASDQAAPPLRMTTDGLAVEVLEDARVAGFMHDAKAAVAAWAAPQFQPQALRPLGEPVAISAERYGKVSTSYVVCTEDRVIAPAVQRQMALRAGCRRVKELPLSHSPFLADPWAVAEVLHRMATEH